MSASFNFSQDLFKYLFPAGIPRNSFIVIAGEGGSGKSVILSHIVKDVLSYGEPVIYVSMDDDPFTVIQQLKSFRVAVDEACAERRFVIIDGFSYLLAGPPSARKPKNPCVAEEVHPERPDSIISSLLKTADSLGLSNHGAVLLDSLNEAMITLDQARFVSFVKSIRANIAKARGVLTVATLHTSTSSLKEYLLVVEHLVDGIIETSSIPPEVSQHIPIFVRGLVVKKMKGTPHKQGLVLFGIDEEGLKPVVLKISK